MPDLMLQSPLQYVKGVGPKKAEALKKYGLENIQDILFYFPRIYLDRTNVIPIGQLKTDESATIIGTVKAHGILYGKRKRYEVILEDDTGGISLIWFRGIKFWERMFKKGQVFACTGQAGYFMGLQMIHPEMERLEDESSTMIHAGRIIPVYPQTAELSKAGLNSKAVRNITTFIFENLRDKLDDYLPKEEREKQSLISLDDAVRKIHYPDKREDIHYSRRRLAFDELLNFQFLVYDRKIKKEKITKPHSYKSENSKLKEFIESLPYELTTGQNKVLKEIINDLKSKNPMFRMMQGDVGCGKTVVAILTSLFAAENKLQTAFMAPTEILAEQHFRNWQKPLEQFGIRSAILTSSLKASQKKKVAEECKDGKIDILFGTHALVYDYVSFARLGLVIIDEQHRFGVEQRGKLYAKGDNPDLLVMTATPIPRTLALTLYGDLDISTIETMPLGRKPVRTVWRTKDVREKVYQFIKDDIKKGGQTYIVYPLIEKSELVELENVEDAFEHLSKTTFKDYKIAMVHGRVKAKERDEILRQFFSGEIDILMATTVIEVGLDNPNATIMVIEHAERFGLAQLHQLRGRIGRGEKQSTLAAIAHHPISEIGHQRLEYFTKTTDGFKIAEADLELRGPGEIFGYRQSGDFKFKTVNISQDRDLFEKSRALLENLFTNYNNLDIEYQNLYKYLYEKSNARLENLGGA